MTHLTALRRLLCRPTFPAWLGICLIVLVWMGARPYHGIRHDGILYLGQVMRGLMPQVFLHDIFFKYGSQDQYSIYSPIISWFLQRGDLHWVVVSLIWCCHLTLLWQAWRLVRQVSASAVAWWSLMAMTVFSHDYGGGHIMQFGEEFLTARSISEPLVLAGLAFLLQGRVAWAFVSMIAAALFHPLMALPGLLIWWIFMVTMDRRWLLALAGLPGLWMLANIGIKPFDGLLITYDTAWWALVSSINASTLVGAWSVPDWQIVTSDVVTLSLCWAMLDAPQLRRLIGVILVAALLAMSCSYFLGDRQRNVLVLCLQMWRVMWILHVVALLLLPVFIAAVVQKNSTKGGILGLSLVLVVIGSNWDRGWIFVLWLGCALAIYQTRRTLSTALLRATLVGVCLAIAGICYIVQLKAFHVLSTGAEIPAHYGMIDLLLTVPIVTLAWVWLIGCLWSADGTLVKGLALLAAAGLGTMAITHWDSRTPWQRFVDTSFNQPGPFAAQVHENEEVYWGGLGADVKGAWFVMKRPSYMSIDQLSGVIFNRQSGVELGRRSELVDGFMRQAFSCSVIGRLMRDPVKIASCTPTDDLVEDLCKKESTLKHMVFERQLSKGEVANWQAHLPDGSVRTFHLYDCSKWR
ncbi:MAG: hypothetical protein V4532_09025 [Pseudomonadota bacterium]